MLNPATGQIIYGAGGEAAKPTNTPDTYLKIQRRAVVPITLGTLADSELPDKSSVVLMLSNGNEEISLNEPQYAFLDPEISPYDADWSNRSRQHPLQEVAVSDGLEDADANPIQGTGGLGFVSPLESMVGV